MDIKQLGISVEAKGIRAATNQLSGLVKVAAQVDPVVKVAQKRLDELSAISLSGTKGQISGVTDSFRSFKTSVNSVADTSRTFKSLSGSFTSLATASEALGKSAPGLDAFNKELQAIHTSLSNMQGMGAALASIRRAAAGGGDGGNAAQSTNQQTQATQNLSRAQQALLTQIEKNSQMVGRTKSEYLELRAAMLGVSSQAGPYIQRIREAEQATNKLGLSAKANAAALRMVPAQFTDVVTQLAGGQNPLLVLIQQGGQLRDMFQGFGNMFRAIGPLIGKFLLNPITLAVAALGTLGYGFIKGSAEAETFGKTIAQTGNYIGLSINQFNALSKSIGEISGAGQAKGAEALTALAATSSVAGKNIEQLGVATAEFAKATGKDVKDIAEEFAKLSEKPSEALLELNKKYHTLTLATYAQVKALEEQGKKQEAVAVATSAHADALQRMAKDVQDNRGYLEKFWDGLTNKITQFKNALLDVGRDTKLEDLNKILAGYEKLGTKGTLDKDYLSLKKQRDELVAQNAERDKTVAKQKEQSELQSKGLAGYQYLTSLQEQANDNDSLAIRKKRELEKLEKSITAIKSNPAFATDKNLQNSVSELNVARARLAIEEKFRERGGNSGDTKLADLRAALQVQQEELTLLQKFPEVYHEASEYKKQLYSIENQIASGKLKKDELAVANEMVKLLQKLVAGETQLAAAKDDYKAVQRWRDMKTWIDSTNESLQEQLNYITETGVASDSRTEIEKKLAAATVASVNERLSAEERLEAARRKSELERALVLERTVANTLAANRANQDLKRTTAEYAQQIAAISETLRMETEWQHLSNRERQRSIDLLNIQQDLNRAVALIQVQIAEAAARGSQEEIKILEKKIEKEKELAAARAAGVNESANRRKELFDPRGTLQDMEDAWSNFYDGLETQQEVFQGLYADSIGLMENTLNDFFTTGEVGWKSLAEQALKMITQVITKLLILEAIEYATNSFGQGGTFGGAFAQGDTFGTSRFASGGEFTNRVVNQPTPFRFANGNGFSRGLMGEAGPEAIMPLARTPNGDLGVQTTGGGGGGDVNISVVVQSDGTSKESSQGNNEEAKQLGVALSQKIRTVIAEEMRPGGLLTRN